MIHILLVHALLITIHTFNIDIKSPYIVKSESDNYFGFSVALHKNDAGSFLMVGAPIAGTAQPNITEGGAVYQCRVPADIGDPTEPAVCSQQLTVLDDTGNKYVNQYDLDADDGFSYNKTEFFNIQKEGKSHQWLGVSLQSTIDSDYFIGCAHRYETRYLSIAKYLDDPPRQLTGKCKLLDKDLQDLHKSYQPCYDLESGYSKFGYCQAGMSAFILDKKFVLGAPGCFEGSGCVFLYDVDSYTMDGSRNVEFTDPYYEGSLPYTGYSSVICDMNGDGTPDLITGGPRGKLYKGEVFIYQSTRTDPSLELVQSEMLPFELTGEQMGSYYGASLLCQDMNGDGLDDLVVGAPWYAVYDAPGQGQPDTGRVYFYPGALAEQGLFLHFDYDLDKIQTITGSDQSEAFGFSMSSAGDVNEDGLYDMFIGSPYYNDGEGRISLFLGGSDGIQTNPSQVISPTDLGLLDNLRGFGWSIAGGKDMDENTFPDVLIGAYKSHHAVLLRTMRIIDVKAQIVVVGDETELDPHGEPSLEKPDGEMVQGIEFQACFEYTGINPDETTFVTIGFQITLDSTVKPPRLYTNHSNPISQVYESELSVELQNGVETCTASIPAYYRDTIGPVVRMDPIQFAMTASLGETETFATRAVLNQQFISDAAKLLPIASDCPKDSGICKNNMTIAIMDVKYPDQDKFPFIVLGLIKQVTVPVNVTNFGPHTAYGPKVAIISVPNILPFLGSTQSHCNTTDQEDTDTYEIHCRLPDQMKANMSVLIELKFDLTEVTGPVEADMTAQVSVSEPSQVLDPEQGFSVISLNIVNLAQLEIRSGSSQERLPYNNKYGKANKVLGYEGPTVKHVYEISLAEDSINRFVKDIVVAVYWPMKFPDGAWLFPLSRVVEAMVPEGDTSIVSCNYTTIGNLDLLLESFNEPDQKWERVSCREEPAQCQKIRCNVQYLERGGARLKISFYTNVEEYFLYDFGELTVESFAEIEAVEEGMMLPKYRNTTAKTVLYPSKSKSKNFLWIVIGAVVGGLLLLAVIIVLLWKAGFFKRIKPEQQPITTVGYRARADETDYEEKVFLASKY